LENKRKNEKNRSRAATRPPGGLGGVASYNCTSSRLELKPLMLGFTINKRIPNFRNFAGHCRQCIMDSLELVCTTCHAKLMKYRNKIVEKPLKKSCEIVRPTNHLDEMEKD
jgi:hypothetical protein